MKESVHGSTYCHHANFCRPAMTCALPTAYRNWRANETCQLVSRSDGAVAVLLRSFPFKVSLQVLPDRLDRPGTWIYKSHYGGLVYIVSAVKKNLITMITHNCFYEILFLLLTNRKPSHVFILFILNSARNENSRKSNRM